MAVPNNNQNRVITQPISEATVNKIIDIEGQRIQLALQKQTSRDKEIEANTKIAEKSIDAQSAFLKAKPKQDRYTAVLVAGIIGFFVIVFLVFIAYLLNTNNKDLAKFILIGLSHFAAGSVGYYARGKKNINTSDNTESIPNAEVVD